MSAYNAIIAASLAYNYNIQQHNSSSSNIHHFRHAPSPFAEQGNAMHNQSSILPSTSMSTLVRSKCVPPGPLGVNVKFSSQCNAARVTKVQQYSPLLGAAQEGDWIVGVNGRALNSLAGLSTGTDRGRIINIINKDFLPTLPSSSSSSGQHWKTAADILLLQQPDRCYPLGKEYSQHPRVNELLEFINTHVERGSESGEIHKEFTKSGRIFIEYDKEIQQWKPVRDDQRTKSSLADRARRCRKRLKQEVCQICQN